MNTRRDLPNLFKTLAKRFGARKAVKLIALTPEVDCTGHCSDSDALAGAFIWDGTIQGYSYWLNIHKQLPDQEW